MLEVRAGFTAFDLGRRPYLHAEGFARNDANPIRMWRRFLGQPDWTGVVRGLIALWLIGFIVYMTFEPPPEANADLVAAARTLAVMVAAFYFGQRVVGRGTVEPAVGSEPMIRPEIFDEFAGLEALRSEAAVSPTGAALEALRAEAEAAVSAASAARADLSLRNSATLGALTIAILEERRPEVEFSRTGAALEALRAEAEAAVSAAFAALTELHDRGEATASAAGAGEYGSESAVGWAHDVLLDVRSRAEAALSAAFAALDALRVEAEAAVSAAEERRSEADPEGEERRRT